MKILDESIYDVDCRRDILFSEKSMDVLFDHVADRKLTPGDSVMWIYMLNTSDFTNNSYTVMSSIRKFSKDLGRSINTTHKSLKTLKKYGFITITHIKDENNNNRMLIELKLPDLDILRECMFYEPECEEIYPEKILLTTKTLQEIDQRRKETQKKDSISLFMR